MPFYNKLIFKNNILRHETGRHTQGENHPLSEEEFPKNGGQVLQYVERSPGAICPAIPEDLCKEIKKLF